jgi:hypothetical protein
MLTLMIAAGYLALWFYWQGYNWARMLVFVTCFLCFYNLRGLVSANVLVKVMLLGEAAVALFLVYSCVLAQYLTSEDVLSKIAPQTEDRHWV